MRLFTDRSILRGGGFRKHKSIFCYQGAEPAAYQVYLTLDEIEGRLKEYGFCSEIHKSYLVNMKHVRRISNYEAEGGSRERLPIPRLRFQAVEEAYSIQRSAVMGIVMRNTLLCLMLGGWLQHLL